MDLHDWFQKGMPSDTYIDSLEKHKDGFHHIYNNFTISNDEQFIDELKTKNLRTIVLAEPWCGHCMLDIPILLRIAEKASLPVKFLFRDENLALMDQYLTNGKSRSIPIMIFIDENGNEVAKWGPIADKVKQFIDEYRENLPDKDAPEYEEKFKAMIEITGKEFQENEKLWNSVYESIKETLKAI